MPAQYTTGSLGDLTWSLQEDNGELTVSGSVSESEPVFVAVYDMEGKLLKLTSITVPGGAADDGGDYERIKLMWLDEGYRPQCECAEIQY